MILLKSVFLIAIVAVAMIGVMVPSVFAERSSTEFYLVDTQNYEKTPTTVNISWDDKYGANQNIPFEFTFFNENRDLIKDVRYTYTVLDEFDNEIARYDGDDSVNPGIVATEGINIQNIYISTEGPIRLDILVYGTGLNYDPTYSGIGSTIIELAQSSSVKPPISNEPPISKTPTIPSWFKNNAGWWAYGIITDSDFFDQTTYLINKNIIILESKLQSKISNESPGWIKNNAGWWADGSIGDDGFIQGIEFLVKDQIIGNAVYNEKDILKILKLEKESSILGVKIILTNTDNSIHSIVSGVPSDEMIGTHFNSGMLAPGDSAEWTAETVGEYPYFDMIHPWESGVLTITEKDLLLLNQEIERKRIEQENKEKLEQQEKLIDEQFNEIAFNFYNSMDYILVIEDPVPTLDEIKLIFGAEKYQLLEDISGRNNVAVSLEERAFQIELMEYSLNTFNQDMREKFLKVDDLFEDAKQQINNLDISEEKKLQHIKEIQNEKELNVFEIMTALKSLTQLEDDIVQMKKELEYEADLQGESLEFDNSICGEGTIMKNGQCVVDTSNQKSSSGGGCLIATATYGSEMAPQVQQLRELRDNQLLQTESGTQFMQYFNDVYYSFSPIIADYERENPLFKEAVKLAITPMISTLSLMENANSESEVLSIGLSVIALNLGMYLGVPAVVIVGIRKTIF